MALSLGAARPLYEAGEYAEAADRGRELIKAHPEYPVLLYNLACCESLAGRTADAIEHLRLAIERAERFRSLAAATPTSTRFATTPHSRSSWASGTRAHVFLLAKGTTTASVRRP